MAVDPLLQSSELRLVQATTAPLIGIGRIAETIADHPVATRQRRLDDFGQMFATGREHQHGLRFKMHRLMQQKLAKLLAERRSTGFAR